MHSLGENQVELDAIWRHLQVVISSMPRSTREQPRARCVAAAPALPEPKEEGGELGLSWRELRVRHGLQHQHGLLPAPPAHRRGQHGRARRPLRRHPGGEHVVENSHTRLERLGLVGGGARAHRRRVRSGLRLPRGRQRMVHARGAGPVQPALLEHGAQRLSGERLWRRLQLAAVHLLPQQVGAPRTTEPLVGVQRALEGARVLHRPARAQQSLPRGDSALPMLRFCQGRYGTVVHARRPHHPPRVHLVHELGRPGPLVRALQRRKQR
mmetsp:Transcript_32781/g.62945  ORF Transcript_32781/g.62945 Transcript_32781/m.62945 type:complete len:268 (-) Transcript_32781:1581-2384(-)